MTEEVAAPERRFYTISVLPHLTDAYGEYGVFAAAKRAHLAEIHAMNLRDFGLDKHGTIDGPPYGGGDGMVLRPEPLKAALDSIKASTSHPIKVIAPGPGGKLWTHAEAKSLAEHSASLTLVFVCGRFGGIDERFIERYVDVEYSLGDVVYSGGELPALLMIDSILRFVPGVLGHAESATQDSFGEGLGGCLEYPLFTRPEVFEGQQVPPVLLSGDHKKIAQWRQEQAHERTQRRRPDLFKKT